MGRAWLDAANNLNSTTVLVEGNQITCGLLWTKLLNVSHWPAIVLWASSHQVQSVLTLSKWPGTTLFLIVLL